MKCKICSAETDAFYDDVLQSDFFHCAPCEFIFKDDTKIVSEEVEREHYRNHDNGFDSPGYVAMFRDFIEQCVTPYKNGILTALEFGCGPGPVLAALLEEEGFTVDKYDKFFQPEPVYENKTYDLITATEVIEHIAQPMEVFSFFHRHLGPGGILALMTRFHADTPEDFTRWYYRLDTTHIAFFRPKTFEVMAERSGFDLLHTDGKKMAVLQKRTA